MGPPLRECPVWSARVLGPINNPRSLQRRKVELPCVPVTGLSGAPIPVRHSLGRTVSVLLPGVGGGVGGGQCDPVLQRGCLFCSPTQS